MSEAARARRLHWSDEFDGPAGAPPNPAHWGHETGGHGWGNGELQCYTDAPENASLDGAGHLVIRALPAGTACADGAENPYSSARLTTVGKVEVTFGRVEVRALLPDGPGTWAAFWMLGVDLPQVGWPACGEIDVMEHLGNRPGELLGTVHGPTADGGHWYAVQRTQVPGLTHDFHTFAAEWTADSVTFSVDERDYAVVTREQAEERGGWTLDGPCFLLLNLAVGGDLGGEVTPTTTWPQELVVDHVRVYRLEP